MTDFAAPSNAEDDINERLRADGVAPYVAVPVDYFGFDETYTYVLPDGVSTITHKALNEGARARYLNGTNREVRFSRATNDASMKLAPGTEKAQLLRVAIVGWTLTRQGKPVNFNPRELDLFLESAAPTIIDLIHKEVAKVNPWLMAEVTIEQIDTEIAALQAQRDALRETDTGKASS